LGCFWAPHQQSKFQRADGRSGRRGIESTLLQNRFFIGDALGAASHVPSTFPSSLPPKPLNPPTQPIHQTLPGSGSKCQARSRLLRRPIETLPKINTRPPFYPGNFDPRGLCNGLGEGRPCCLRLGLARFPPKTRTSNDDQAQFVRADETCGPFVQRRRVRGRPRKLRNRDAHPLYAAGTDSSRHSAAWRARWSIGGSVDMAYLP
jgi:hypothetical protein